MLGVPDTPSPTKQCGNVRELYVYNPRLYQEYAATLKKDPIQQLLKNNPMRIGYVVLDLSTNK